MENYNEMFGLDIAMETAHPFSKVEVGLKEISAAVYGFPTALVNAFVDIDMVISLAMVSFFDNLTYTGRIKALRKEAEKTKDPYKKAILTDKAKRAEDIATHFQGFVHKNPIDKKLKDPKWFDKVTSYFEKINYGINQTYIDHLTRKLKNAEKEGNVGDVTRYKFAKDVAQAKVLESAMDFDEVFDNLFE